MFYLKFRGDILSFLKFWGHCVIDHVWNVGFGAFLKCVFFFLWCNLDNVGGLWNFDNVGKLLCC